MILTGALLYYIMGSVHQCSDCFLTATSGCKGAGNGKACAEANVERANMSSCMQAINMSTGYESLNKVQYVIKNAWGWTLRRSENSILKLMIIFRVKINGAIYIEPRNGFKIFKKWVLGMSIFTQNLTRPPLRRKKNILKYRVYCIQKNRLCNTVSTKQLVN